MSPNMMNRLSRQAGVVMSAVGLAIVPGLHAQETAAPLDRMHAPVVSAAKPLTFPMAQQRTLTNGIPVVILEDHTRPVVSVSLVVRLSLLVDPPGKTGIGSLVSGLLGEGTTMHTADQLADQFATLGNGVSATGFYTITENVDQSLDLMAEQFLHPAFPQTSLDRNKANMLAQLQRVREDPGYIANRIIANTLYGATHPYAREATPADVATITRDDIVSFYQTYYRPPNIKVIVAGDITPDQAVAKLNRIIGDLPTGTAADFPVAAVQSTAATTIYLYDRPSSSQSVIVATAMGPRRDSPDRYAIALMSTTLGGAFNSRLNMNLREQHHYAYGAHSGFSFRAPPQPSTFTARSAVETPKTDSALIELVKEIRDITDRRPVTESELALAKAGMTKGLPLQFETINQRTSAVAGLVANDEPLDYYNTVIEKYNSVTLSQTAQAAQQYITPGNMVIVVVGDRQAIEPGLRAANIAPVVVLDSF